MKLKGWPITKRETKDGPRYDCAVYLGTCPETGKRLFHYESFPRLEDAKRKVGDLRARKGGGGPPPVPTSITFQEWLDLWLEGHATQARVRTVAEYGATVKRWITNPPPGAPRLGPIKLRKLTSTDFDRLYLSMFKKGHREKGLKPKSIRSLHVILRMALEAARKKGLLAVNPAEHASIPKENAEAAVSRGKGGSGETAVRAMGQEEASRFLAAAKADERFSALWHVLLLGGLRPCEVFALTWDDVDFEAGTIRVEASLNRLGLAAGVPWQVTLPKTSSSLRTIPLPSTAMRELGLWRTLQKRDKMAAGPSWEARGFDFVFTTQTGSPLDLANLRRRPFRNVMRAAGLGSEGPVPEKPSGEPGPPKARPFTPAFKVYDLRHTCASLLLSKGVPLQVVSGLLGHKSISTTSDFYAHLVDDMPQQPANTFEAMFGT